MRGAQVNLTARKESAGAAAVRKLAAPGLAVVYHQLDVTDEKSIAPLFCAANVLSATPLTYSLRRDDAMTATSWCSVLPSQGPGGLC
jgi:NAD(P)-dependent dehydrogenase (short-subunit alcohol dehydrogenase family)